MASCVKISRCQFQRVLSGRLWGTQRWSWGK